MKLKQVFAAALAVVMLSHSAFAGSIQNYRNKIKENNQKKVQLAQERNQKNKELKEINQEIYQIDAKIGDLEASLSSLQEQLKQLNIRIRAIKEEIAETEKTIEEKETLLGERIRAMYKTSDMTYIQLLMESKSIPDLVSNAYNVQKIVNADRAMLEELERHRKELEEKNKQLLAQKDQMTAIQEKMKREQAEIESARASLATKKTQKAKDIELLKLQEAALQKENNSFEQKILAAQRASGSNNTPYSGGAFQWLFPVRGTLTSPYGYRSDPFTGYRSFHLGQDIAVPRGTAVYAVAAGTVLTSRYQNSYGNVVVIDHGGGLSTVYAHNSALLVSEGATVVKGQTIAKVGSTGNSTGNHLHFEVRVNGKTTNPMSYFK